MDKKKPIFQILCSISDLICLILSISVMIFVTMHIDEVSNLKKSSHTKEVFDKILWAMATAIVIGYLSFLVSLLLNCYSLAIVAPKTVVNCLNLNWMQEKIYKELKRNEPEEISQIEDV